MYTQKTGWLVHVSFTEKVQLTYIPISKYCEKNKMKRELWEWELDKIWGIFYNYLKVLLNSIKPHVHLQNFDYIKLCKISFCFFLNLCLFLMKCPSFNSEIGLNLTTLLYLPLLSFVGSIVLVVWKKITGLYDNYDDKKVIHLCLLWWFKEMHFFMLFRYMYLWCSR